VDQWSLLSPPFVLDAIIKVHCCVVQERGRVDHGLNPLLQTLIREYQFSAAFSSWVMRVTEIFDIQSSLRLLKGERLPVLWGAITIADVGASIQRVELLQVFE
jgi:hypothetical protein